MSEAHRATLHPIAAAEMDSMDRETVRGTSLVVWAAERLNRGEEFDSPTLSEGPELPGGEGFILEEMGHAGFDRPCFLRSHRKRATSRFANEDLPQL